MTVPSTSRVAGPFTGTGADASLPFTFKVFAATDLLVTRDGAELTYGTDYTVTVNADQDASPGGAVAIVAAANTLDTSVWIETDLDAEQQTSITNLGGFYPKVIEQALDRVTMLVQQLKSSASRLGLSASLARANLYPVFDANGNLTLSAGTGADAGLRTDLASPAKGAALVAAASVEYATKAVAAAASPALGSTFRTAGGSSAGDGGSATYKVVSTEPSHPGKIALANGKWGEIVGPYLPVEAFGAVGDCPDVSGYNPATQQATIAAAVTAATNDISAFQDAFKTAKAIGGATVTYGHGKRYRIAFDHRGVFKLVMGDNTTLQRIGGGWLEFDPSLITGEQPSYTGLPTNRAWHDPGLCAGDPDTGLEQSVPILANSGTIVPASAGITSADFAHNVHVLDADIRCHTRPMWQALTDTPLPSYRRLRMYGIKLRSVIGCSVRNCFVKGLPNDGFFIMGRDIVVDGCISEANGHGGVNGTSQNNYSIIGLQYLGLPDLSADGVYVTNCTSRYAKDEGLAKAGIKSLFIRNFTSIGDHDRAIEGISGYKCTLDSATVGEPINGDCTIEGVFQDGLHQFGTATTTAGSATVSVSDAFWLNIDTPGSGVLDRYLFIPGAGAGGSAGPFRILAVDYAANTVTVADDAGLPKPVNTVANASAYVLSRVGVAISDANEMRTTLRGLKLRNIYATAHPVQVVTTTAGRHDVSDIELENITTQINFHAVSLEGERVTADNIRVINGAGAGNSAVVRTSATYADVTRVQSDGGFEYVALATNFSGAAKHFHLSGCVSEGCKGSAVRLSFPVKCGRVVIEDNYFGGVNASGSATEGFVLITAPTLISGDLLALYRNTVRWAGMQTAYPVTTTGGSLAAGTFTEGRFIGNDLMDPAWLGMLPTNSPARMFNNFGSPIANLIVRDNSMPGSRVLNVSSFPPTAGRFYLGDELRMELPATNGAAERFRCLTGGSYDTLTGVTVAATVSSTTIPVNDASKIKSNDTLVFVGGFTRQVAWVDYGTNTLTLTSAVSVTSGGAVAFTAPVFANITSLYLSGSKVFDPPSVAAQVGGVPGVQSTTVTVTGAALGDLVIASFSLALGGLRLEAEVTAANTVTVYFINTTAGAIDLGSGTLKVRTL